MGGLGNGIGVTTSLIALISNAAPADQAIATACSYLFRSLGSVVGLAVLSTVVQQSLKINLQEALSSGDDAEQIVKGVRQSLDFIKTLEPEVRALVVECYALATRTAFGVVVAVVGCAALASCKSLFLFFFFLFFLFSFSPWVGSFSFSLVAFQQ